MNRSLVWLLATSLLAAVLLSACAQGAPSPTTAPTKAPAAATPAPAKAASEPTKASAAPTLPAAATKAPAAAPAVDYPAKGKSITFIVPWGAGGQTDIVCRMIAGLMEKDLGVPFVIVNKVGASGQVGLTDMVKSKPDGYTIAAAYHPHTQMTYLDPEAKAPYFGRNSFELIALIQAQSSPWVVRSDGPFKTLKDVMDTAKAKPGEVKLGTTGLMGPATGFAKQLEDEYKIKLSPVHFQDGNTAVNAVLGGHVDVVHVNMSNAISHIKSGALVAIATSGKEENRFAPGVKTFIAQGYNLVTYASIGLVAPAGTPKPIVDILAVSAKKAMDDKESMKKLEDAGNEMVYMDPKQYATFWDETDVDARRIITAVRGEVRKQ